MGPPRERGRPVRRKSDSGRTFGAPRVTALVLMVATLLLSGCVYLRLLELKLQLGKFDEYFALQTNDGLAIICHTPVLRTDDVRWIGLKPESTKKLGRAEHWQVRWVKQLPPGITATSPKASAKANDLTIVLTAASDSKTWAGPIHIHLTADAPAPSKLPPIAVLATLRKEADKPPAAPFLESTADLWLTVITGK